MARAVGIDLGTTGPRPRRRPGQRTRRSPRCGSGRSGRSPTPTTPASGPSGRPPNGSPRSGSGSPRRGCRCWTTSTLRCVTPARTPRRSCRAWRRSGTRPGEILARLGFGPVGAVGEPFDPARHEAAEAVDEPSVPAGTIVRIIRPGYGGDTLLLRPAVVAVARAGSGGGAEGPDADRGSDGG